MTNIFSTVRDIIDTKLRHLHSNSGDFEGNVNITGTLSVQGASYLVGGGGTIGPTIQVDNINGLSDPLELDMLSHTLKLGSNDPFSRPQITFIGTNAADPDNTSASYDGTGSVLRLGALAPDGDPDNIISEGITVYGQNTAGAMNNTGGNNYGYARIKPLRFQLRESILGTGRDVFRVDGTRLSYMPTGDTVDALHLDNTTLTLRKAVDLTDNNVSNIGKLTFPTGGNSGIDLGATASSITQLTSITTGVTLNAQAGTIVTVSTTLGANASATFTVTNSKIAAGNLIFLTRQGYTGSTGTVNLSASNIVNGAFDIIVKNSHYATALNGIITIAFMKIA